MSHARSQHPNAPFTPEGRRRMVDCVLVKHWTIEATAERFQVDAKTVRKWRDRFLAEGEAGLCDRSSRPHSSPNRTPRAVRRQVIRLRKKRRKGAAWIGFQVGLAASTVQTILNQAGLGRLDIRRFDLVVGETNLIVEGLADGRTEADFITGSFRPVEITDATERRLVKS